MNEEVAMKMPKRCSSEEREYLGEASSSRPLNIFVVVKDFPALSETFVLDHILALRERGWSVSILAYSPRNEGVMHEAVRQAGLLNNVIYVGKPTLIGTLFRALCSLTLSSKAKWSLLLEVLEAVLGKLTGRSGVQRALSVTASASVLAVQQLPDVALCHFGDNGDIFVRSLKHLGVCLPVVTVFHGSDMSEYVKCLGSAAYDQLFASGTLFCPVTRYWCSRLREMGCPRDRIRLLRMGLPLYPVERPPYPDVKTGAFTIFCTGRLVEKKGHEYVLKALAECRQHRPDVHLRLIVAGDGPLRTELENLAHSLDVASDVEFAGSLPREKLISMLKRADAFVLASVTSSTGDMEGLPVALMEAMALGVPVISTFHSGIPELVEDGSSGLLVNERDVEALALAICRLATSPALANMLAKNAYKTVQEHFSSARWNEKLVEIIREAVSIGGGSYNQDRVSHRLNRLDVQPCDGTE